MAVCDGCRAVFRRRHWLFDEALYAQVAAGPAVRRLTCPACRKISDGYYEGEVTLTAGPFLDTHKEEILNLIRNEEERARGLNPLERIVAITEESGKVVVTTTNEKLAQRIGRELKKAYQGKADFRWSEDTKCLRVKWTRE
jgi:NMD protein affecting ribosome stability and mRNA decay